MERCVVSHPSILAINRRRASAKSPRMSSYQRWLVASVFGGRLPVPMETKVPTGRPGYSFSVTSSSAIGEGLKRPWPSSMKTLCPIWIGLKANPVADVARPACQIVQLNSGAGSLRES